MSRIPYQCGSCRALNMVDVENLKEKPARGVKFRRGYVCEMCGVFNTLFLTTTSMNDAMKMIKNMNPKRQDFRYRFSKVLRKVLGVQE